MYAEGFVSIAFLVVLSLMLYLYLSYRVWRDKRLEHQSGQDETIAEREQAMAQHDLSRS